MSQSCQYEIACKSELEIAQLEQICCAVHENVNVTDEFGNVYPQTLIGIFPNPSAYRRIVQRPHHMLKCVQLCEPCAKVVDLDFSGGSFRDLTISMVEELLIHKQHANNMVVTFTSGHTGSGLHYAQFVDTRLRMWRIPIWLPEQQDDQECPVVKQALNEYLAMAIGSDHNALLPTRLNFVACSEEERSLICMDTIPIVQLH